MRLSATKSFGRPVPEPIDWFLGPQIKELDSIRRPDENWHKGATLRCDLAPLIASAHVPSRGTSSTPTRCGNPGSAAMSD